MWNSPHTMASQSPRFESGEFREKGRSGLSSVLFSGIDWTTRTRSSKVGHLAAELLPESENARAYVPELSQSKQKNLMAFTTVSNSEKNPNHRFALIGWRV